MTCVIAVAILFVNQNDNLVVKSPIILSANERVVSLLVHHVESLLMRVIDKRQIE
jgi:hypothetical protein